MGINFNYRAWTEKLIHGKILKLYKSLKAETHQKRIPILVNQVESKFENKRILFQPKFPILQCKDMLMDIGNIITSQLSLLIL